MVNSIEIKNFKSIKKKYFPLRNLNILLGLNGMGKSSFIQTLLVLRQSYDLRRGYKLEINNGSYVKLGSTKDVLYQYSKNENLSLNLEFRDKQTLNLEFDYDPTTGGIMSIPTDTMPESIENFSVACVPKA